MTTVSWEAHGSLDLEDWVRYGGRLAAIGRAAAWWIGDWLGYGNARFGERYTRAVRITRYDVQTLMNMVHVSSRFAPHERRDTLSWSHHAAVAQLEPADRDVWLNMAESERMSVRCLRDAIRTKRRRELQPETQEKPDEHVPEVACPSCGITLAVEDGPQLVPIA